MFSRKHKIVFIHIPKTAGTSMTFALKGFSMDFAYPLLHEGEEKRKKPSRHLDYREYKKYLINNYEENIEDYNVFTIIRNPWERLISHFIWMTSGSNVREFKKTGLLPNADKILFKQRGRKVKDMVTFDSYIKKIDSFYTELEYKTQFNYLISDEGDIRLNQIIRYENLMDGIHELESKMGIKFNVPHVHVHRTDHGHYSDYFQNDESYMKIFMDLFKDDVDYFNYPYQNGAVNG